MDTTIHIVDVNHYDDPVDFHAMSDAGAVGVILKATQGSSYKDPKFIEFRERAMTVFDAACVHSYHFLDDSDPNAQIENYLTVTDGMRGRWLDYEPNKANTCSLDGATSACHILAQKQGSFPGMYGSDGGLLGQALLQGHFTVCPLWIARYSTNPPLHKGNLWQYQAGESATVMIGGKGYDLSMFMNGDADACKQWMASLAQ
ncbi:MAG: glycoside hydrolase family 25 protein [Fimbriimonas sp.]|nr:glycoside hydrolase family 25 protein [Fimbriimonas sp.]